MTTFDFSPLFRSTVGFDRLMRLMESSTQMADAANGYPPYNIEKTGEDQYRITVAVAGFGQDELNVESHENTLVIEGRKKESDVEARYLYRGIAGRSFKRQFQVADHVKVIGASLNNGLLIIDLVREIPEAMKPRRIPIMAASEAGQTIEGEAEQPKQIEVTSEAA
ncbi:MAG TPA: Hsp20 family protein [Rhodospirillales bacterium]|nr:Hsp20 family protein [Rhodospirillales bacterium]